MSPHESLLTWSIIIPATAGTIIRPFRLPEAVWAVAGAVALVLWNLLTASEALRGIAKGLDVYFFLTGMMLTAELARCEGLFDYLAAFAVEHARGSPQLLFLLVYAVGILVTSFLSNDATAIVLTPAVYAATRAAGANPLPYLFACAFIANAASFVLPISNPANLVVFGERMPHLFEWLRQFALPSVAAIVVTYVVLCLSQRHALAEASIASRVPHPRLGRGGRLTAIGIAAIGVVLLTASALDVQLGLPTFICGLVTAAAVLALSRQSPRRVMKGISWSVLPLVAGLFVMVEALLKSGAIDHLNALLQAGIERSPTEAAWSAGIVASIADNIANNLPVGLVAGSVAAKDHLPAQVLSAMLIGVDLGPNLSVTGSLATILWLVALRREKVDVSAWRFLKIGVLVTPPALLAALAAAIW
ncbi:arsenic transporter [Bradyrhizobium neotropicale]|uniref:arsenic transporter n=1 Tax=Bradyrhizobium neotropicale TaxID=1497615 RepID=UPI001AD74E09|nr:arsenic transporter [Bradyrhizobium neotropicale]MBO4223126.1 arsenic transporter [Bradyrhizobium neotropicale]